MDKDQLLNLIDCGYCQRELANHFNCSRSKITYWLNIYNISTKYKKSNPLVALPDRKICSVCKIDKKNTEFYRRKGRKYGLNSRCKDCTKLESPNRKRKFKNDCVDHKGGECQCCGYNNCNNALDFHHIDPKKKKFNISDPGRYKITQEVLDELDKCILVCSNCHREIHAGYIDLSKENISNLQEL